MKPERTFAAERVAARHCPELLREGPAEAGLIGALAVLASRAAEAFPARLASLTGGEPPAVQVGEPRNADVAGLALDAPPLAVHCLLAAGAHGTPMVATIEGAAIFRLIDRAFGGEGRAPDPLPAAFPPSAELMTGRLESAVAVALSDVFGVAVAPLRREANLARLDPFSPGEPLGAVDIAVADGGEAPWRLTLTLPLASMGHFAPDVSARKEPARDAAADPLSGPFGDVPLALHAVLVDMPVPFATLAALAPGQIIPVAVARSVPLETGGRILAHGAAGAMDDRVAIRVTQLY